MCLHVVASDHGLQDKCAVSTCVGFNLYCTMLKYTKLYFTYCNLHNLYAKTFAAPLKQHNTSNLFVKDFQFIQTAPYLIYFKIIPPPRKTTNLATRDEEKNKRVGTITYDVFVISEMK